MIAGLDVAMVTEGEYAPGAGPAGARRWRDPPNPNGLLVTMRSTFLQHERRGRAVLLRYGVPLALLVGLTLLRTYGISSTFWLHGDQIRDWTIALGPWYDLPLSGTPSSVGGRAVGPVFYWTLWAIRVVVGPFTDYLPHAGGIGISLIQSVADAALFVTLRRRFESTLLALAVVVAAATAPFDVAPWRHATSAVSGAILACVLLAQPARFEASRELSACRSTVRSRRGRARSGDGRRRFAR